MLGSFLTRILLLALGYAYPAFECFKTIEKNRVEIQQLQFWCQYWILVALITVFERFGDIFMSWLPMYGEMKLVFFIYLWYPKTKGTSYVYGSFLKPYMTKHEPDIDRNIQEVKARAWDVIVYYGLNCTQVGRTIVFQGLEYLTSQGGLLRQQQPSLQKVEEKEIPPASSLSPPPPATLKKLKKQQSEKGRPPIPPPSPAYNHQSDTTYPMNFETVQIHLREKAKFVSNEGALVTDKEIESSQEVDQHDALHQARLKLRRTRSNH